MSGKNIKISDLPYNKSEILPFFGNIVGFDKLAFDLPNSQIPNLKLENLRHYVDDETGEISWSNGEKGKIMVKVKPYYTRFEFNPALYLYDNNFYTVGYSEFLRMVDRIEEEFGFSIRAGKVRILHPQATLNVDVKPEFFFNVLGNSNGYRRMVVHSTSLYYFTGSKERYKTILVYDKKEQAKPNIPKEFKNGDFLRFEFQFYNEFIRKITKKIDKDSITIGDLMKPETYKFFIHLWYQEYVNIQKEKQSIFDLSKIRNPKDILKQLAGEGVRALGGLIEFEKILDGMVPYINIRKREIARTKASIRKIVNDSGSTIESPLLSELNSKIDLAYQNTLAEIENYAKNIN